MHPSRVGAKATYIVLTCDLKHTWPLPGLRAVIVALRAAMLII